MCDVTRMAAGSEMSLIHLKVFFLVFESVLKFHWIQEPISLLLQIKRQEVGVQEATIPSCSK